MTELKDKAAEGLYGEPRLPKAHAVVNYDSVSPGEDFCGNCIYWLGSREEPTGQCSLVEPLIAHQGICDLWLAIPKVPMTFMVEATDEEIEQAEKTLKSVEEEKQKKEDEDEAAHPKKKVAKKKVIEAKVTFSSIFLEAADKIGTEWKIRIIEAGTSANNNHYPLEVLHASSGVFENVPVYAASGQDHSPFERGVRSQIGFIKSVQNVPEGIDGIFHVSDGDFRGILLDLFTEGVLGQMMGFSIVADGEWESNLQGGKTALKLTNADSVDLVKDPAAGGKFLKVTESKEDNMTLELSEEKLAELIKEAADKAIADWRAKEAEGKEKSEESEEESEEEKSEEKKVTESVVTVSQSEVRLYNRLLETDVKEAKLPDISVQRLISQFKDKLTDWKIIEGAINTEKDYIASLTKSTTESVTASTGRVVIDEADKYIARLDAIFTDNGMTVMEDGTKILAFTTFKEAYCRFTGTSPYDITGHDLWRQFSSSIASYDSLDAKTAYRKQHFMEASLAQSDWSNVIIDRLHNALVRNYNELPQYQDWRKVARVIPVTDFQPWRDTKVGGYADLPVVVEAGTYPELTHPADEQTSATLAKHGGIAAQITRELIINDQINAISQIPLELARAAARTLYKAVFDVIISGNGATYGPDSTVLFHTDHNNLDTSTALSIAGLNALEILMRSQTKMGSTNDILGAANTPTVLIVPNELRALALRLANPSASINTRLDADADADIDPEEYKGRLEVITLDYNTDPNDYYVVADPRMVKGIGVLFMNGNEEPELFIQRDETVGEVFSMDVQNIKIRHEWETVLTDFRPFASAQIS